MTRWWLWRRRKGRASVDARLAVEQSQRNLADTYARWDRVHEVAEKAEKQMRQNHFAPTIAKAMGEHR